MQEQRPVAVICGRRLLLRQHNIRGRIIEREILSSALHQYITGANVIANRRQIFAFDMDLVCVEVDAKRNRVAQCVQDVAFGQRHDLPPLHDRAIVVPLCMS
jgi:hypothetical protein